jgi:hypothetical protein
MNRLSWVESTCCSTLVFLCRGGQLLSYAYAGYAYGNPRRETSLSQFVKHRGEFAAPVALFAITASYAQRVLELDFEKTQRAASKRTVLRVFGWLVLLFTFSYLAASTIVQSKLHQRLYDVFHTGGVIGAFVSQICYFCVCLSVLKLKKSSAFIIVFVLYASSAAVTGILQIVRFASPNTLPTTYPKNLYYAYMEAAVLLLESIAHVLLQDVAFKMKTAHAVQKNI